MARSRSSGGRSSGSSGRSTPSFFGSAPSRSSHTSTSSSPAPVRTATPQQSHAPPPALASTSHAPASHSASSSHPPAHQQQQQMQPSGGGGMLSGLAGTVMQGMAFGGGSAIAHRAVDSIAGPRTVVHEHQGGGQGQQGAVDDAAATTMSAIDTGDRGLNRKVESACGDEVLQFQRCLQDNNNNINTCSFYFDVLSQCQRAVKDNARWQ